MPVQPMNFTNAPISQNPLDALVPALQKGMILGAMPSQLKQQQQSMQLANALKQIQLQYAPQTAQADLANKQASTDYTNALTGNIPTQNSLQQMKLQLMLQKLLQQSPQAQQQNKKDIFDYQTNEKNWNTLIGDASQKADSARTLGQLVDNFDQQYNQNSTFEKGSLVGRLPAMSSSAQITDRTANAMVAQMLNLLKGNRITNQELGFLQTLKPSRSLNSDAENSAVTQIRAASARTQEALPFFTYAKKNGLSPEDAQALWQKYDQEHPTYDVKKNRFAQENIGKWKDYIDKYRKEGFPINNSALTLNNDQANRLANFFGQSRADTSSLGGSKNAANSALVSSNSNQQITIPKPLPGAVVIQSSDGQYHQVATNKLAIARQRDPNLKVVSQ